MAEIWARFSFLFFYSTLHFSFRFYSHVAGAGLTHMLWCMKDYTRHAAQLLGVPCFFTWVLLFSECMAGDPGEGWDDFRLWLCKRKVVGG
jgi:hypothetical protein